MEEFEVEKIAGGFGVRFNNKPVEEIPDYRKVWQTRQGAGRFTRVMTEKYLEESEE